MSLYLIFRKSVTEATVILIAAVGIALVGNAVRERPLALISETVESGLTGTTEAVSAVRQMSLAEAVDHFNHGTALFVDARSAADYSAGHIAGAVNLPDQQFDEHIGPFLEATAADTRIITYCDGESCPLSERLAEKLSFAGFEKVFHLKNGWGEWKARGLPVEGSDYK
jgi:rhodanese-related sulfurtransferase